MDMQKITIYQFFLSRLRHICSIFVKKKHPLEWVGSTANFLSALQEFQQTLKELKDQDDLIQPTYLSQLSSCWNSLKELLSALEDLSSQSAPMREKIDSLIRSIDSFHYQDNLPLGFYLSQGAGTDWAPFPLLDTLVFLKTEGNPTLQSWILDIEEILEELLY